jgi:hypothetical protein
MMSDDLMQRVPHLVGQVTHVGHQAEHLSLSTINVTGFITYQEKTAVQLW